MARTSKITRSEQWWEKAPKTVLRCSAHYKSTGGRCKHEAAPGSEVCNQHGALAPAVQAAAARRIQMSVDDAAKKLLAMVEDPDVEAREKVKILHDLLDRGGLAPTSKVLLGVVADDPVETLFRSILTDPAGLADPTAQPAPALPRPDPAQEALDRAEAGLGWDEDLIGPETDGDDGSDIVDAELVDDYLAALPDPEVITSTPPRHIREALARLL